MLSALRNSSGSWVAKIFLTVLALSFVAWGVGDFLNGNVSSTAIKVDGYKVSVQELAQAYNRKLSQLEQQLGMKPTAEIARVLRLPENTINELVQNKLWQKNAHDLGLRASDNQLRELIQGNASFQDADGTFNPVLYKNTIRNNGLTVEGYEKRLRDNLVLQNLSALFAVEMADNKSIERLVAYQNQAVDLNIIHVNTANIPQPARPSEDEQKSYFAANGHTFTAPESRSGQALFVMLEDVAKNIEVSAKDVEARYNEAPENYAQPEMRKARHILLESEEEANALLDKIDHDADFTALAKENSIDTFTKNKGGDLGLFAEGEMFSSVDAAVFSMNEGDVSDPVESPLGFHIIKLEKIQAPKALSFDEVKDDIKHTMQEEMAEELYYTLVDTLSDQFASGARIEEITMEPGMTRQPLQNITHEITLEDMPYSDTVKTALFNTEEGIVSTAVDVPDTAQMGVLFVEVSNVTPQRALTFEEAQVDVIAQITEKAHQEAVRKKAQELANQSTKGGNLVSMAKKQKLTVETVTGITRSGENKPAWLRPEALSDLLTRSANTTYPTPLPTQEGMAVLSVVKTYTKPSDDETFENVKETLNNTLSNSLQYAYATTLRAKADVNVNGLLIKRTLGEDFPLGGAGVDLPTSMQ